MLGSTTNQRSPTHLPASGEARRPGKQAEGQPEQPCILLPSVPYALKPGDRADLGGTAGLGLRVRGNDTSRKRTEARPRLF
jgi:hypothetical protein